MFEHKDAQINLILYISFLLLLCEIIYLSLFAQTCSKRGFSNSLFLCAPQTTKINL
ncbi:hypothetical protein ACJX0J_041300, partial [Zea mays]